MLVDYMCVSSDGDRQSTALQRDALHAAGVDGRHSKRIEQAAREPTGSAWPVPSRLPGLATAWSSGSWIGSAGRCRTC